MAEVDGYTVATSVAATDYLLGFNSDEEMRRFPGTAIGSSAGKIVYVDSVNGSDSTGARGKPNAPFLTLAAAQTAASSGDCIHVLPGSYTPTASLGKAGVNWHLESGVTITVTQTGTGVSVFSDGGTAMTFVVSGAGTIVLNGTLTNNTEQACVKVTHASSDITVECHSLTSATDTFSLSSHDWTVYQTAGTVRIRANILASGAVTDHSYNVGWVNGAMDIDAGSMTGLEYLVYAQCSSSPTGDMFVRANSIIASSYAAVVNSSTNTNAKLWLTCPLITAVKQAVILSGAGKTYITAQKIAGCTTNLSDTIAVIQATGGFLWLDCQKLTGTYETGISFLTEGGVGSIRARIMQLEDLGTMARAASVGISGSAVFELWGCQSVMATGDGVLHQGGTSRIMDCRFDTSAQSGKVPVRVSGSGLILDRCTLVPHASAVSVTAASSMTITAYKSVAKTAKHANVTVNVDALTVDSNVV